MDFGTCPGPTHQPSRDSRDREGDPDQQPQRSHDADADLHSTVELVLSVDAAISVLRDNGRVRQMHPPPALDLSYRPERLAGLLRPVKRDRDETAHLVPSWAVVHSMATV